MQRKYAQRANKKTVNMSDPYWSHESDMFTTSQVSYHRKFTISSVK